MPGSKLHSFARLLGVYPNNRILFFGVPVCSDVGTFEYSDREEGGGRSV